MKWMRWLLRPGPALGPDQRAAIDAYRQLPSTDLRQPLDEARFVVVDVETNELDPFRARPISIGALSVQGGCLFLGQGFHAILRQPQPSSHENILIHGIEGGRQLAGRDPATALIEFLKFCGKAPLVGFVAAFDQAVIERAVWQILGIRLANPWLDLAKLLPALCGEPGSENGSLDVWMSRFRIESYARHDAMADAFATAQLFLIVLAEARKRGIRSTKELKQIERHQSWLEHLTRQRSR
jgi:DNA polymerase-3 subunit epsilon